MREPRGTPAQPFQACAHESRRRDRFGAHDAAGGDHAGDGLTITIRIGADGRIYFQDITGALLPVVDALRRIHASGAPDAPATHARQIHATQEHTT